MTRPLMIAALLAALALPAGAETPASQQFAARATAAPGLAAPIGSYARGCLAGGVELPETGPTWQAMRLSRGRNWGHPEAIALVERLSREATRHGWKGLYVGDIGQPRGGPTPTLHRSHQLGLDVDIWMRPPERLDLTVAEREALPFVSVRSDDQRSVNENWTPTHMAILKTAAQDPAVDRIFITAPAKIAMCDAAGEDRAWLQKIRPIFGHDEHFHVRLKCPKGASACQPQTPTVAALSNGGDGCDASLRWWVTDYLDRPKPAQPEKPVKPVKPRPHPRDYSLSELPRQCAAVLAAE